MNSQFRNVERCEESRRENEREEGRKTQQLETRRGWREREERDGRCFKTTQTDRLGGRAAALVFVQKDTPAESNFLAAT